MDKFIDRAKVDAYSFFHLELRTAAGAMQNNNNFNVVAEEGFRELLHHQFAQDPSRAGTNLLKVRDSWLVTKTSLVDFVAALAAAMNAKRYYGLNNDRYVVECEDAIVTVDPNLAGRSTDVMDSTVIPVILTGVPGDVTAALAYLDTAYSRLRESRRSLAKWWYMDGGSPDSTTITLEEPAGVRQEFYPWLPDHDAFFKRYIASDVPLLFIAGPPGTGKTTLLRDALYRNNLCAAVAYDDSLFKSDSMFISFLTSQEENVLIIEDADPLLASREHAGNKLIARFLNVSDGIIRFPKKKIIFTTNLRDFNDIDAAMIRPGRCFSFVHARELTYDEAVVAARVADLPPPPEGRDGYSLADLFKKQEHRISKFKAGFV